MQTARTPDVLIQNPTCRINYLIPGKRLADFETDASTWGRFGPETVTFVIPDPANLLEEMPPALRAPDADPAVHIQDPAREAAYYLEGAELAAFAIDDALDEVEYDVSFIVPVGLELIEEMPPLMRGLLQTQENGSVLRTQMPESIGQV